MPHMIDEYPQPWRNRQDDDAEQARVLLEWDESDKRGCAHWLIAGVVALLVVLWL